MRYRFVTDGPRKADGKRRQVTKTFDTKKEARDELARIRHQSRTGEYVAPTKLTVNELLDIWLKASTRDVEEATSANYDNAVRPIRNHLGYKRVQQLTEEDVEEFVDWLVTSGRRRGGKPGTGLGARSVQLTLGRFRSALNLAVRRGWVVRNVAEHVRISREARNRAKQNKPESKPWDEAEVKAFIEASKDHRLLVSCFSPLSLSDPLRYVEPDGVRMLTLQGRGLLPLAIPEPSSTTEALSEVYETR